MTKSKRSTPRSGGGRATRDASEYLQASSQRDGPDRHVLYQRSVQSPKGDISYLLKFFLAYVGGKSPLHFREDFCGTALICSEWVKNDVRRTAVGLDLDLDALDWGVKKNLALVCASDERVLLFQGNVLFPLRKAKLIFPDPSIYSIRYPIDSHAKGSLVDDFQFEDDDFTDKEPPKCSTGEGLLPGTSVSQDNCAEEISNRLNLQSAGEEKVLEEKRNLRIFPADIACAFNFSTCCLHTRRELVQYFKCVKEAMNAKGSIFAMDLYGGYSSECSLILRRKFGDFTYTWEQEEFDVLTRMTRISIHFRLEKEKKTIKRAFSYQWRLWTIPEARECLLEAGFKKVHVWMRQMSDLSHRHDENDDDDYGVDENDKKLNRKDDDDDDDDGDDDDTRNKGRGSRNTADDSGYEETDTFLQCDAWNAYIVAVI